MVTVRCNQCMKIFPESKIIYDEKEEKEYCPYCGETGYLMDLSDDQEDD